MSVQINNDEETVEITRADFETLKAIGPAIADQNALVLDAIKGLFEAMVAQAENLTATFASLRDEIANLNITVNVPEQPAPIVNVTMPEQPAAQVTVKPAPEKKKKVTGKFLRDRNGALSGFEETIE